MNQPVIRSLVHSIVFSLSPFYIGIHAADWPMFGRDATRNSVSPEKNPPVDWDVGKLDRKTGKWAGSRNIKWTSRLGSQTTGDPVVADGLIWVGTNNWGREDFDYKDDASVLMCFRASDGKPLYEYVSPRLPQGRVHDWDGSPLASSPLIEGDRMWFVTNRCETVCLDIGPLKRGEGKPRIVWKLDMIKDLGVFPKGSTMVLTRICSVASYKDRIYVITGNALDETWTRVPKPEAPSLICVNKETGKVMWSDNSPGANILSGQWASPLVIEIDGRAQVIAPQGDGWLRSFDALSGELIWTFDMNYKSSKWILGGRGTRNNILAAPVLYDGCIYVAVGQNLEHGEGSGRLCCIDPTKRGDISSELGVDAAGKRLPHRRLQAVDPEKGEKALANPNSGLVWEYTGRDQDGSGRIDFEETFHRTLSSVAIKDGLLFAVDFSGLVHCFDAKSGRWHWAYDMFAMSYAQPLIVDDKVYVCDEDGDVAIFNLSANKHDPLTEISMGSSVYTLPVFAGRTLYVASRNTLFAIQADDEGAVKNDEKPGLSQKPGFWPQWRGPNRDNVSAETGLLKKWPDGGPPLLWRVEGLGEGIASVAIAGGRVVTLGYRDEQEYVTAVSEKTGEQLWMTVIGPAVAENHLMRWLGQRTPTLDEDRVYAVRSDGDLVCLQVDNGRELWRKSYVKDFGTGRRNWGICDYPLVDGEKLICSPGGTEASIVALKKTNGEVIWKTIVDEKEPASYVATVTSDGGGVRQYVTFLRRGLVSVAADDGKLLWRYDKLAAPFANSVTPIVRGDAILAYNGYGSGRALLKLISEGDGVKLQEQYFHRGFLDPFQDSTLWIGDYVHTFRNRGILERYDARTGESTPLVKRISRGNSSMTYADGHVFLRDSSGVVLLIEMTEDDYVEQSRFTIPNHEPAIGATNPVIAAGRLWLRDDNRLFCYDVREDALDQPPIPALITLRPSKLREAGERSTRPPRSVFVPTPQDVVEQMLELAEVKKSDVVYDLGSGDGRIVIAAAKKYGCRAVGYEIDKDLVELSRDNITKAKVEKLVAIHHKDLFTADLARANVVAVYLLPKQLERLLPQLDKLKPGSRIVSHHFAIPGVEVQNVVEFESNEDHAKHKIYLWTTPLKSTKGRPVE